MAEKGLDYYLQNPDELPADPSEIEALMSKQDEAPKTEEVAQTEPEPEQTPEASEPETKEEASETVVLTKDGKRAIPYSVLASERDRRQAAEHAIADLQRQMQALQDQATGAVQKQEVGAETNEDDLDAISEDFPQFKSVINSLKKHIGGLEQTVQELRERDQGRVAVEQKNVQDSVQAAIDANPVLSYWQEKDPEMFEVASNYDELIRNDPKMQSLSLEQRLEKVVKAVEVIHGPTQLPKEYQSEMPADEAASLASKAIRNAGSRAPRTLSDMPGGMPPAQSEMERVEGMSTSALAAMMSKMTPDDLQAFLAKTV